MKTSLFSLLMLAFAFNSVDAQQIYFYFNDASVQVYSLEELDKIDFDAENINLHLNDETVVSFDTDLLNYYRYFAEGVTSVNDLVVRPDFKVFPNPAENNLNVRFDLPKPTMVQVSVRNLQGLEVLNKNTQAKNQDELNLDLSGLASGQYICVINTGEYLITKSFIRR
jgi:hypothetical protein